MALVAAFLITPETKKSLERAIRAEERPRSSIIGR
jgi:hypothetical protein